MWYSFISENEYIFNHFAILFYNMISISQYQISIRAATMFLSLIINLPIIFLSNLLLVL